MSRKVVKFYNIPKTYVRFRVQVIEGLQSRAFSLIRDSPGPKNLREDIEAFTSAVNWKENWIRGLLIFHVMLWVLTLASRKAFKLQVAIFFVVSALVRPSALLATLYRTSSQSAKYHALSTLGGRVRASQQLRPYALGVFLYARLLR